MGKRILFLFLSFFAFGVFSAGFAQAAGEVSKDVPDSVSVKDAAAPAAVIPHPAEVKKSSDAKTDAAPAAVIPHPAEVKESKDAKTDAAPAAVIPHTAEVKESNDVKTEANQPAVIPHTEAGDAKAEPNSAAPDSRTEISAKLSSGLYHYEESGVEFAEEEDGISGTGTQKMQMDLKADGTFTLTIYATVPETGMEEQIIKNFRGTWKQDREKLIQSGILAQYFNFESNSFSPWESPDEGETEVVLQIRNITPGTFQEYDEASDTWITWIKL